jgi:hypothetical protein
MLAATLAMAPIYSLRLTSRNKTDCAAQAAAFELVGRAAHNLILHFALKLAVRGEEARRLLRITVSAVSGNAFYIWAYGYDDANPVTGFQVATWRGGHDHFAGAQPVLDD